MKNVLFEDGADFRVGSVLSESGGSLQVSLASGKQVKVKVSKVLLHFERSSPKALLEEARQLAETIDLGFLWDCAPQGEFGFLDFAKDYFGHSPSPVEAVALLLRLHDAPIYFQRKGRGRYSPASPDQLQQGLAAVERRQAREAKIQMMVHALLEGTVPDEIAQSASQFLANPDKDSMAYKAFEQARARKHLSLEQFLLQLKLFPDERALHQARFLAQFFPNGPNFKAGSMGEDALERWDSSFLPCAQVEAFSIDDSATTEIDDCLSVQAIADGRYRVGIHIAAPAMALEIDSSFDRALRNRASSLYMPGEKITMMPQPWVAGFSLDAGATVPAVSFYFDLDSAGTQIVARSSRVERVRVATNLRYDCLEVTQAALEDASRMPDFPHGAALQVLWRLTLSLCAQREQVRGKPEPKFQSDFNFYITPDVKGVPRVKIVRRSRDAPLDRLVTEMMILANTEWGGLLAEHGVAGLYRSQQTGRAVMTTHPMPHQGLGVRQYLWATSPLRRYPDLVNQRQLTALLQGEPVPFAENDPRLFSILSVFEAKYPAYLEFQRQSERYWCLVWLSQELTGSPVDQQHGVVDESAGAVQEQDGRPLFDAIVVRDGLVRLAEVPLYFRLTNISELLPGQPIRVAILSWDLLDLSVQAKFVGLALPNPDPALRESFD